MKLDLAGLDPETLKSGYSSKTMAAVRHASLCTCGRPRCVFRPAYLEPLREHIAKLHHVIGEASYGHNAMCDGPDHSWSAVTYQLQMAASIEDLAADTGFVDRSGSIMMCRPAAEYEARHSAMASRYAAGLVVFNFLWAAYEAAIKVGAGNFLPKEHTAFRGRQLMTLHEDDAKALKCFARVVRRTKADILHIGDLEPERAKVEKFLSGSAAQAAELVRLFRNHLVHGSDKPPVPDQAHGGCRTVRFYSLGRVILLLVQIIALQALQDPASLYEGLDYAEYGGRRRTLRSVFLNLQFEACRV